MSACCQVILAPSSPVLRRRRSSLDGSLPLPLQADLPTDGNTSPVARRRSKTECGWSYGDRPPGPIRRQPLWLRRRRNLSETTNRATPSSPLNRSFDAQTAARSSLIMLAVGHASPRPKSVSVSVTDADGLEEEARADSEDEEDAKDGRHFLKTVDQTEREIRALIAATEADLATSEGLMSEEVSGALRTAIGKATLLVTDKFAQFRGLCEENLAANSAAPYATRCSDLEGFWEMVGLQVTDIRRMFREIRTLRDNGWRRPDPPKASPAAASAVPASPAPRKAPRRPATAPTGAKRSTAPSTARDEARKRLMAAKREAMAKKKAAAAEPDIIFVS